MSQNYEVAVKLNGRTLAIPEIHVGHTGSSETNLPLIGEPDDHEIIVFKSLRAARKWLNQQGHVRFRRVDYRTMSTVLAHA